MKFEDVKVGQYVSSDLAVHGLTGGRVVEVHEEERLVSVEWPSGRTGVLLAEDLELDV